MRRENSNLIFRASVKSLMVIACAFLFFGCGGASSIPGDGATPAQDLGELSDLEQTIYKESYAGYLVVFLNPEVRSEKSEVVKSVRAELVEAPNNDVIVPTTLQPVLTSHPIIQIKPSISISPAQMDARRRYLELISGKQLADFNLIYHVEVADPDEAVRVMRELEKTDGVDKVYPKRKGFVATLATVPDLTGTQGYLESNESNGGLNARAAWTAGATGNDIIIVDAESEWNFGHEDLNLTWGVDNWSGVDCYPTPNPLCTSALAHGTAIAGIISSVNNGHGTTGFAYDADLKAYGPFAMDLITLVDGIEDEYFNKEISQGSILFIEVQHAGILSDGSCSGVSEADQYGCLSFEAEPEFFAAIEYLTTAGVTVVDGAGNGSVDLDSPATYWSHEINLSTNDSGSILVGGSQGSNHQKISFSNFGSPVDAYAWAQSVVTTAYPYGDSSGPYYWTPGTGANPPNDDNNAYYTNRFGGTSSATAMVAGAAVLVQSYAKNLMGHDRYLTPLKLREILTSTGVTQSGGGGNIGKQPRIDRAMAAVDTLWTAVTGAYPELSSSGRLTTTEMIALRSAGVGLICIDRDPINSDPACPDDAIFIPGTRIAKSLDFDGDGRADLVSWTNGQWKVDLSSVGSGGDNYGSWDLMLNYTPILSRWVWPYVEDYNSDGREDFAVYDKEHGKWYIAFTTSSLLGTGIWAGWDWEIDYSAEWVDTLEMDPWDSQYSRPAPGDYNGDGWIDIAIACSDGYWRIDHGGADLSAYGTFDQNFRYMTATDLTRAPGWAYLTVAVPTPDNTMYVTYKIPDGLSEVGKIIVRLPDNDPSLDVFSWVTTRFGGNDTIPILSRFDRGTFFDVGIKSTFGKWDVSFDSSRNDITELPPIDAYGGLNCRPIATDFDGDGVDDRAVMCPDEWRIAFSGDAFAKSSDGVRYVELTYNSNVFTLPGRSYSGGISYSFVQQLIAYDHERNPTRPPSVPVDMVSTSVCQIIHDPECR